jgi:hypothetical protein
VSITLMSSVWPLEIPPNEKLVILALADNANDAGECWPSMATLKLKTSLSERTIQRCLRELEAKSLVQVEARYGRSNVYVLSVKAPVTVTPPSERHPVTVSPHPRHRDTQNHHRTIRRTIRNRQGATSKHSVPGGVRCHRGHANEDGGGVPRG